MKLGSKIEFVRKLAQMERKNLSDKLGISYQAYANIENNATHISDERLAQIASIFHTKPEAIKNIDPHKIYNQINGDQNLEDNPMNQQHNNDLLKQLLDNKQKVLILIEKRISLIEDLLTKADDTTNTRKRYNT